VRWRGASAWAGLANGLLAGQCLLLATPDMRVLKMVRYDRTSDEIRVDCIAIRRHSAHQ
jgi:hypothetical protein